MAEPPLNHAPRTVTCAVCATPYDDDPAARRVRRCPACGSRLIRQEDGRLGAVTTAPPPPPPAKTRSTSTAPASRSDLLLGLGIVFLVICAYALLATVMWLVLPFPVTATGSPIVSGVIAAATGAVGAYCIASGVHGRPKAAPKTKSCRYCSYPLPLNHLGRCPECGRLQNPTDPAAFICPGCRRSLHGFFGDACPECSADIRMVVDGHPPDREQA